MNTIIIESKLSLEDYRKVNLQLIYKRWSVIFMTVLGFIMLFFTILILIILPDTTITIACIAVVGMIYILLYPVLTYFSSKSNYASQKRIGEAVTYTFDDETIRSKGESFESTFTWDKVYRISQTKQFLLLWESKVTAHIVPLKYCSAEQLNAIRTIASKYKNIKQK